MAKAKTKREMFTEIRAFVIDNQEWVDFIDHELELLDRKGKSPRKPTKTQVENEAYKVAIYDALVATGEMVTMKELYEICPDLEGLTTQRVTHILTSLIKEGQIKREIVKRIRYYGIVTE